MRQFSKEWSMSRRKPRETISVCGIVCGRLHNTGTCGALVADLRVREIAELSCSQETTKPLLPLQRLDFTLAVPSSILMFRVFSRFAHSLALFLLLDLSLSLFWFSLELGAFQFVEIVIVLQQLPIRTTTELPSMI